MRQLPFAVLVAGVAFLSAACGPETRTFVGTVSGTDAFIGLRSVKGKYDVYVCDGKSASPHLVAWFRAVEPSALKQSGDQGALDGSIQGDRASGKVTIAGESYDFSAKPIAGQAAFFSTSEVNDQGQSYTAWWIVLEDGQRRGACYCNAMSATYWCTNSSGVYLNTYRLCTTAF